MTRILCWKVRRRRYEQDPWEYFTPDMRWSLNKNEAQRFPTYGAAFKCAVGRAWSGWEYFDLHVVRVVKRETVSDSLWRSAAYSAIGERDAARAEAVRLGAEVEELRQKLPKVNELAAALLEAQQLRAALRMSRAALVAVDDAMGRGRAALDASRAFLSDDNDSKKGTP